MSTIFQDIFVKNAVSIGLLLHRKHNPLHFYSARMYLSFFDSINKLTWHALYCLYELTRTRSATRKEKKTSHLTGSLIQVCNISFHFKHFFPSYMMSGRQFLNNKQCQLRSEQAKPGVGSSYFIAAQID